MNRAAFGDLGEPIALCLVEGAFDVNVAVLTESSCQPLLPQYQAIVTQVQAASDPSNSS